MYEQYKFDYARNSLRYLIKNFGIREIYIPYYLCDVIRHSVIAENCRPLFYHIDDDFYPAQDFPINSYILYPNYFGICESNVNRLEKLYPKLITDNAHAFYLPPQGFACFNSERKFRNVEKGSYLWIKNTEKEGNFDNLHHIYHQEAEKRKERFSELNKKYEQTNQIKIDINSVKSPFCYPYLANNDKNANELAENLTKEGLTIYRYWNNLPKNYNEYKFYRRLVPIPI